jgi:hypothetical protein
MPVPCSRATRLPLRGAGEKDVDVLVREASRLEPRRHRICRELGIAGRGGGVDFGQFLVDVARKLLVRRQWLGGSATAERRAEAERA